MKSVMAGQPVSPAKKAIAAFQLCRLFRRRLFTDSGKEVQYHRAAREVFAGLVDRPVEGARVLEVGCGQTAPLTALWLADGADAWGIDVEIPTVELGPARLWRIARTHGLERALKSFVRHLFFDRGSFARLEKEFGKPLALRELSRRLLIVSATRMEFPDNHFDFIFSRNVFEHIDDVPAAVSEIDRVLKPGGVAWISLHLFPSLTGGHNLEWLTGDLDTKRAVPPWDHLRENKHQAPVYLNRHRLEDYRRFFRDHTEVIREDLLREPFSPLTPALEAELTGRGYTVDDLLTRHVFFVCRKRRAPAR